MGKFTVYRVEETMIAVDDREVDRGYEFWNVSITSRFTAPPEVLVPGATHPLTVTFEHSGSVKEGNPGTAFHYNSNRPRIITPAEPLPYSPWSPGFAGVNRKTYTLTVPQGRPGDKLEIYAGWGGTCGVCNVTWKYKAE